jgi:recombination protein RecA
MTSSASSQEPSTKSAKRRGPKPQPKPETDPASASSTAAEPIGETNRNPTVTASQPVVQSSDNAAPGLATKPTTRRPAPAARAATNPAVAEVIDSVEKAFGKGSIMTLGETPHHRGDAIGSGAYSLDRALGIGGYPRGRIVEIFGPESSGKTTLTLHAIAETQRRGGLAAFIDAEHAFDPRYASAIGVDTNQLLISQPDFGEQALDIAQVLTKSAAVDLIVIDSVAALVPKAEIDGDMGDAHMGLHARLMSQALRKLTAISNKNNTTFIFINQLRQKIGVVFGNPETTTGGNALKFYSSVRLDVRRIGKVTSGDEVIGNRTRVKVVKNKCAQPFTEAEFDIRWGVGIDALSDLLDSAVHSGVVQKNGAHYVLGDTAFGHGREKARRALLDNPELFKVIEHQMKDAEHRHSLDDDPESTPAPRDAATGEKGAPARAA